MKTFNSNEHISVVPVGSYTPVCRAIASGNLQVGLNKVLIRVPAVETIQVVEEGKKECTFGIRLDYVFGEKVSLVSAEGSAEVVTVKGQDYLGQAMTEKITLNGATAVESNKAFKLITSIEASADAAADITLATVNKFGMEFQTAKSISVLKNGVNNTTISVTAFEKTQTATSNDARGTINCSSCSSGDEVEVIVATTEFCTKTAGKDTNGGLFGHKQFG